MILYSDFVRLQVVKASSDKIYMADDNVPVSFINL